MTAALDARDTQTRRTAAGVSDTDRAPAVSWTLLGLVIAAWSGALVGFAAGVAFALWRYP